MTRRNHIVFLTLLVIIVAFAFTFLVINGSSYYSLGIEDRVYHENHTILKPSGLTGHGLGIAGTLSMLVGVFSYMARKRFKSMSRMGLLKHWLEFHIFLCTLGPLLILFHTAFKFGGLVAVSFWSMTAVFISGVIGRFIYIQIPRSIEGRALSLSEIRDMKTDMASVLRDRYKLDDETYNIIIESVKRKVGKYFSNPIIRYLSNRREDRQSVRKMRSALRKAALPASESRGIIRLATEDIKINRRIERLDTMQNLFKYWHVAHLPFAIVMFVIMLVHVTVTIVFGYRWIF